MNIYRYIEAIEMPKECPVCGTPSLLFDVFDNASVNDVRWQCCICGQPIYFGQNTIISDRYFYCYLVTTSPFFGWRLYVLRFDSVKNEAKAFYRTRKGNVFICIEQHLIEFLSSKEDREKLMCLPDDPERHIYDVPTYHFRFYQGHRENTISCYLSDFKGIKALQLIYDSLSK